VSAGAWALVGVVVGAILGAVAQIVADQIATGRENRRTLRAERRAVYTEFMAAASSALQPLYLGGVQMRAVLEESRPASLALDGVTQGGDAMLRLGNAGAAVHLVAPEDTHAAANTVQIAALEFLLHPQNDDLVEKFVPALEEFKRLAQRDLAI
jgi:hypothetical protein